MMMVMMALLMITPRWWPPRTLGSILAQGELQVGGTSLAMSREVLHNNWNRIRALTSFIQKWPFEEYLFRCETSFRDKRSIASVDATWYGGGGHSEKGEEHWQIVVVVVVRNIFCWTLSSGQSDRKESPGKMQVWFESGICTACDGSAGDITGQDSEVTKETQRLVTRYIDILDILILLSCWFTTIIWYCTQKLQSIWHSVNGRYKGHLDGSTN